MKYEGIPAPTITFKSTSYFYEKEESGMKCNTVRIVSAFELQFVEVSAYIKIVKDGSGEHFTRKITDLSFLGSILGKPHIVISWNPNEAVA